ncbi:MAG: HAMP domain-containing histidine kinase [Deltaproteobacteria bacterium]|nr:HAMP domain-containing histidine kinase [Deltaproteobacteria bacterium]
MIWSMTPALVVDILGSSLAIVLAGLCYATAGRLLREEPDNALWCFLFWFSAALAIFALSRSVGHILKHVLILSGYPQTWKTLAPYSGAINTLTFILIASVTIFFQQFQAIYTRMSANHAEMQTFSRDLLNLNRDLETMVMERTMAEMALGVADGIRNPICVIGGFSRLLLKRLDPEDPTREWLTTIAAETKRMEEMVAKFESLAEKREYFFAQEDLNKVVQSTLTTLAPEFAHKEIDLQTYLSPEPLLGKINGHLLRVALSHVLRNAIEATPRGGGITLTTRKEGEQARLEIEDTGRGMPPEVVEQIFTPFYTTKIGGTGLGLVFVRQIVEEHRGDIQIESHVGQGTRVYIDLPQRFAPRQESDFRPLK